MTICLYMKIMSSTWLCRELERLEREKKEKELEEMRRKVQ